MPDSKGCPWRWDSVLFGGEALIQGMPKERDKKGNRKKNKNKTRSIKNSQRSWVRGDRQSEGEEPMMGGGGSCD